MMIDITFLFSLRMRRQKKKSQLFFSDYCEKSIRRRNNQQQGQEVGMKSSLFLFPLLFGLFCVVRAEGNVSHPYHGVVLVVDQHSLSEADLQPRQNEAIIDASESSHPIPPVDQASDGLPEHWTLLTNPSTFHSWLNASTFYPSDSRSFEWKSDAQLFPDWVITNRSVIHWKLSEDSSFQASSRLLLD